jgi:hypothetical protein
MLRADASPDRRAQLSPVTPRRYLAAGILLPIVKHCNMYYGVLVRVEWLRPNWVTYEVIRVAKA